MTYSNPYASTSSPTNFIAFSGMGMRKGGRPSLFPGSGDGSTLNLDFTTGVLDPRLTFSRASTATFVNSSGYVEYAAHNLYYNTNFATITTVGSNPSLTGTGWGYALNSGTSFSATFNTNGSVTMSAAAGRIGLFRSAGFAGTGRRLIFSVDITSVGDTGLPPSQLVNEGTKTNDAYYIDGTLWTSGNVVGPCTVSFVFTSNPSGNAATYFGIGMSNNSTGVVTFAKPRWGFYGGVNQLAYSPNTSATNANYLTAEYHAPRFDYSPTTIGEPMGLLIEGQGANYVKSSNTLIGNGWTLLGDNLPTVTAGGGAVSPDGITNATKVVFGTTPGSNASRLYINTSFVTYPYTQSVWLKSNSGGNQTIWWLGTGSVALTVTPVWQRFQLTLTASANLPGYLYFSNESNVTNPDISIWGAQLELGSGASSLIPTGASQVTRNADLCSMTGSNFTNVFGDGSLGTITCSHEFSRANHGVAHQPTPFAIGSYTATNARGYSYGSYTLGVTSNYGWVYTSANFSSALTSAAFAAKNKCAIAYNGLALTSALNGTTNSTTGSGTITISSATGLLIGYNSTGATGRDFINACVSNIKFYPTALTAAQLQALTTP